MGTKLLNHKTEAASVLLKALSNEKRLHIACVLDDGEKAVGELEKIIGLSQSALSQHLARLRRDEIVKTRREAQTIYYSLYDPKIKPLLHFLCEMFRDDD